MRILLPPTPLSSIHHRAAAALHPVLLALYFTRAKLVLTSLMMNPPLSIIAQHIEHNSTHTNKDGKKGGKTKRIALHSKHILMPLLMYEFD